MPTAAAEATLGGGSLNRMVMGTPSVMLHGAPSRALTENALREAGE